MSEIIITENLGKKYIISHQAEARYTALRDVIADGAKKLIRRKNQEIPKREEFWALRNISFKINQGERVGIIGRNGAGKTTLLKLLSRITEPSEGRIKIKGRVASLLEVGTGFHPELTGRENIYLNGAVLGMTRLEIKKKFDDIVSFSGVEKFLDTPAKRYSSGMYVRLAFAVAAHLEPEILLVDEVLAVGDIQFQKKCIGRMDMMSKEEGRTILFVSHNTGAIKNLCQRSILIEKGKILYDGLTENTLNEYSQSLRKNKIDENTAINDELSRRGSGDVRISGVSVYNAQGEEQYNFGTDDVIRMTISYKVLKELQGCTIFIGLKSGITNECITSVRHIVSLKKLNSGDKGTVSIELSDVSYIRPGEYPLYIHISESMLGSRKYDVLDDVTHPIVIAAVKKTKFLNFEPSQSGGYFSIPSKVLFNRIYKST